MSTTAEDRRNALLFVTAAGALLATLVGIIGARRLSVRERPYVVVFHESVSGLEPASVVEYKGVPIGAVRDIRLRAGTVDEVEVVLGVRADIPIKADMRAQLRAQGITGLYQLELVGGTLGAPDLEPGGRIPAEPSLLSTLEAALRDVAEMARGLRDEGGHAADALRELRGALVATRDAARAVEGTAAAIGTDVRAGVTTLRGVGDDVRGLLADPAWRSVGPDLASALQELRAAAAAIESAAAVVARVGEESEGDVRAALHDLRRTSGDLRAVARKLRESPASLVVEHPPVEKPFPDPPPARPKQAP